MVDNKYYRYLWANKLRTKFEVKLFEVKITKSRQFYKIFD